MAIEVPRSLVEFILLGPEDDRRQLQDSPILGDVWIEFAKNPDAKLGLLITPSKEHAAGSLAWLLANVVTGAKTAYLQGIVAARLSFWEVLAYVVPMSRWWLDDRTADAIDRYRSNPGSIRSDIEQVLDEALNWHNKQSKSALQDLESRKRYIALAALILWGRSPNTGSPSFEDILQQRGQIARDAEVQLAGILKAADTAKEQGKIEPGLVYTISLNRRATPALTKSVPAVKADAASRLFDVDCSDIVWAVLDSGIDASHPAFRYKDGRTDKQGHPLYRVKKTFDFTRIRDIVSLDNLLDPDQRRERVKRLLAPTLPDGSPGPKLIRPPSEEDTERYLEELARDAKSGRSINWELVERLVEIEPTAGRLPSNHGTHVAGILAASKKAQAAADKGNEERQNAAATALRNEPRSAKPIAPEADAEARDRAGTDRAESVQPDIASQTQERPAAPRKRLRPSEDWADGMCPDIHLYDFRVLGPSLEETEFAIIAALQYIRYVNDRHSYITVHGANLSLSIPHDVRNYACGRTPICNECERLVNAGVVVVAAAGNRGYQNFETKTGLFESYAAFSITDPGNADGVITVGATHRFWPHTYGVSFFSSRGPTGDGRRKPDLVAPGERIRAPVPNGQWGDLDGTSMAAPHVSGAAAMLMARYSELIGQPSRIKEILCQSATDLGREKSFQGHGMLDVLRAFQSV